MKIHFWVRVIVGLSALLGAEAAGAQTSTTAQSVDTSIDKVFYRAEVAPDYPGGQVAWIKFLNHNLHYPMDAISNEISGTVMVQFVVYTDSTIGHITAISGPTKGGLREEAMRVIAASGKWIPATQNGYVVNCYKKQPIKFVITVK